MRNLRPLLAGLGVLAALPFPASAITFARDNVLGTSFELTVVGVTETQARACETQILVEINRLSSVLSTYDSKSDIRRVMAGGTSGSSDLAQLLAIYAHYSLATSGAIHVNLGKVKALWSGVDANPTHDELAAAFASPRSYNVDALGKAYIIDRCVELGRRLAPSGLVNIGGDLRAWGDTAFPVRIADPFNFSDNSPGLGTLHLKDAAIAASGSYLRGNHLIDPRTLTPVSENRAATVIAPTAVAANAWATALCVAGEEITPIGVTGYALHRPNASTQSADSTTETSNAWPAGYQVKIGIAIKAPGDVAKPKRPYVAVWIEDEKGNVIRNLAFWGDERKYFPEMTAWYKANKGDESVLSTLASATRKAGQYVVTWDGKDASGKPVPQGKYRVKLEVNREHGDHVRPSLGIMCGNAPTTVSFKPTVETDASDITFGPAK